MVTEWCCCCCWNFESNGLEIVSCDRIFMFRGVLVLGVVDSFRSVRRQFCEFCGFDDGGG